MSEIIVNTDSDEAIKIAKDYSVAFLKRSMFAVKLVTVSFGHI